MDEREAFSVISQKLHPGETLLWHGAPSPWRAAVPHLPLLAFMTFWTGIIARSFFMPAAKAPDWHARDNFFLLIVPVLMCLIGAGIWLWTAKKIADGWRTAYGLTNRRVIVAVGGNGPVKSYCAAAFSKMERKGDTDRGTILFDYGWKGRYGEDYRAGLFGIPGPSRVEALIDRTLLAGKEKGGAL